MPKTHKNEEETKKELQVKKKKRKKDSDRWKNQCGPSPYWMSPLKQPDR